MAADDEPVGAKLAQRWRMRCPEGHVDLRDKQGPTVYFWSCEQGYAYEALLDARHDSLSLGRR